MEGIKVTDQTLYTDDEVQESKNKIWSIFSSEGVDLQESRNRLKGESTLNSYEIDFLTQGEGTRIQVKYGFTVLGVILTVILLAAGVVFGALMVLIWYMKMDEIKSSLSSAFSAYVPPNQVPGPGQKQRKETPPPPPED